MTHTIRVAQALVGPAHEPKGPCVIALAEGRIAAVRSIDAAPPGRRLLAIPAPVNAHDHARPLSTTSFGAAGKPLESWLLRLAVMPPVDPHLAALAALGRAARGGVAGAMVHLTRPMTGDLVAEGRAIARAADEIGIRIALALPMKDKNPIVYGDHAPLLDDLGRESAEARATIEGIFARAQPAPRDQIAAIDAVADAIASPMVDVQYGPTGVQWCSTPLLEAIAEASAASGRRVHMHLLETRYQRDFADAQFPDGIVRHLKEIGLLSPRLTLAHCVHARPDELALIAEAGATIALNTSSNLHLRSGIAPVRAMLEAGVRIAMGIDGCAFDEDDDALREMRLLHHLHAGLGFEEVLSPSRALEAACAGGRVAIGAPDGGVLTEGAPADILLLDLDALDRDALMPVDPTSLLATRAHAGHIAELIVAGRSVAKDGRLARVDLDGVEAELRARYRAALPGTRAFAAAWPRLEPRLAAFYRDRLGCC